MAYNYYRYAPGWGTQQFQLGAPPLPTYQPQPTWTGQDFYSAHAMGYDPNYYHNTISRLSTGLGGFGRQEARMWHRRAYAGFGEVTRMMPPEIGAAAAYEAYRQIKYGTSVYNFLYEDYDRQHEALRAMAIAEAVRLWQDTGRAVDQYGLQAACDSAAATANNINMERELEDPMGYGTRSRRNSFAAFAAPGYASSGGFGGGSVYGGGGSPLLLGGGSMPGTPGMMPSAIPMAGSAYSAGVPYASSVGMPVAMPYGGYAGSYGSYGSYGAPGYDYLGVPSPYSMGGYASLPGTPGAMLIAPPDDHHRRHRHRHHHHHHRRHRSRDRY